MSRFHHVPAPVFSPTRCVSCTANRCELGFIDLIADAEAVNGYDETGVAVARDGEQTFGHLYLCGDCVAQAAALAGWKSPQTASELEDALAGALAQVDTLKAELETEREPGAKVVSVAELGEYLRSTAPQPAAKPRPRKEPAVT